MGSNTMNIRQITIKGNPIMKILKVGKVGLISFLAFLPLNRSLAQPAPGKKIVAVVKRPEFSQLFRNERFANLKHITDWEKIVSIIKSGGLLTGEKVPVPPTGVGLGANRRGKVFLDVSKEESPPSANEQCRYSHSCSGERGIEHGDLQAVILIFDLTALDSLKFHASSQGWLRYGEFDPSTDLHYQMSQSDVQRYFDNKGFGEIVLYEDLPLKFLKSIWVHPQKREDLLKALDKAGIAQINGKTVAEMVVSPPNQ